MVALVALGKDARAQPSPFAAPPSAHPASVRLVQPTCPTPPVDVVAFVALLRIELATDGVASVDVAGAPGQAPLAVISLEVTPCSADAREVLVTIDDAATRKSVRRAIHLGDVVPSGRARALALAVAELMRASWAELAMPDVPPPVATVPAAVREGALERAARASARAPSNRPGAPAAPRRPWLLSLQLEGRAFLGSGSGLVGARGGAMLPVLGPLRLRLDAGALYGTTTDVLGDVELQLLSGRIGLALASDSEMLAAELGPRLELGWGGAEGRPFDSDTRGSSGGAFVSTMSLAALLRVRLVDRWWAVIEPEVGGVLRGFRARADERAPGGITGAMVGVGLGFAARL
jgi:hypothetical protein